MAKLIVSFDEMGGIGEFNGQPIHVSTPYILNKACDYINQPNKEESGHFIDESKVNWKLCYVDFVLRQSVLILEV